MTKLKVTTGCDNHDIQCHKRELPELLFMILLELMAKDEEDEVAVVQAESPGATSKDKNHQRIQEGQML